MIIALCWSFCLRCQGKIPLSGQNPVPFVVARKTPCAGTHGSARWDQKNLAVGPVPFCPYLFMDPAVMLSIICSWFNYDCCPRCIHGSSLRCCPCL
ncbi:hypothetical protein B0O80DRAFT_456694 [Mortierella sp. GBAus27b]|nr:hypothetical protein B0O80DRAFT_456694 [Mortierella sp. GBAus27b]